MNSAQKWGACLLALWLISASTTPAQADPLPGETLKFGLAPQDGTAIVQAFQQPVPTPAPWPYFGHDEESSAWVDPLQVGPTYVTRPGGQFMADDFQDTLSTPVVHVRWWGSYLGNSNRGIVPALLPNKFLIAWESDVPVGPGNTFSHPGSVLQTEVVHLGALAPASGTFTEKLWAPAPVAGDDDLFVYNAELSLPFAQQPNTIYWLKIVALFDQPFNAAQPPVIWGWHNRDYTKPAAGFPTVPPAGEFTTNVTDGVGITPVYHYLDDAVSGDMTVQTTTADTVNFVTQTGYTPESYQPSDGPTPITGFSKDLAFELYTIPEPSSLILMGLGIVGLVGMHARKKRMPCDKGCQ